MLKVTTGSVPPGILYIRIGGTLADNLRMSSSTPSDLSSSCERGWRRASVPQNCMRSIAEGWSYHDTGPALADVAYPPFFLDNPHWYAIQTQR